MGMVKRDSPRIERELICFLEVLRTSLKILEATKVPIVDGTISTMLTIIDVVQEIRDDKEACVRLANRAGKIVLDIHQNLRPFIPYLDNGVDDRAALLLKNIQVFSGVLDSIQIAFHKNSSQSLWHRIWRKQSINNDIAELSTNLAEAQQDFQTALLIISASAGIVTTMNSATRTDIGGKDAEGLTFRYSDIQLGRAIFPRTHKCPPSFWSNMASASVRNQTVLVKTYPGSDKEKKREVFLRELKALKSSRHGNLPPLYGFPGDVPEVPFVIIGMSELTPLRDFLAESKASVSAIWQVLVDMFDATQFLLESDPSFCQYDMEAIIRDSVVDGSGSVVIAPIAERHPAFDISPMDLVRVIQLVQYNGTSVVEEFDDPADVSAFLIYRAWHQWLKLYAEYRTLGFALANRTHRTDLLKSDNTTISNTKRSATLLSRWRVRPEERLVEWGFGLGAPNLLVNSAAVGDVGYLTKCVDNGRVEFKVLLNVAEDLGGVRLHKVSKSNGQVLNDEHCYVRISPFDKDGKARNIRYSHGAALVNADSAWNYLSRRAVSIGGQHGVQPENLILVTHTFVSVNVTDQSQSSKNSTFLDKLSQAPEIPMFDCIIDTSGQISQCRWSFQDDPRIEPSKQQENDIMALGIPEAVISSRLEAFVQLEPGDTPRNMVTCKL